jgi:ADP-heptose:LPS heptosyltransferase
VGIIAGCDAVLCTDTSSTHVAAAVRRPSVTMFQFIDPDLRIRHYPKARGWSPDAFRSGKWWGRSHPYPGWSEQTHDEDPEIIKPWKKSDLAQPARLLREFLN